MPSIVKKIIIKVSHLHDTKKEDLPIFVAEPKRAGLTHWLLEPVDENENNLTTDMLKEVTCIKIVYIGNYH